MMLKHKLFQNMREGSKTEGKWLAHKKAEKTRPLPPWR